MAIPIAAIAAGLSAVASAKSILSSGKKAPSGGRGFAHVGQDRLVTEEQERMRRLLRYYRMQQFISDQERQDARSPGF